MSFEKCSLLLLWCSLTFISSRIISKRSSASEYLVKLGSSDALETRIHSPGNGFKYQVRFPLTKRKESQTAAPDVTNTQDDTRSESRQTNDFVKKEVKGQNLMIAEENPSFYGIPADEVRHFSENPEVYLPPEQIPSASIKEDTELYGSYDKGAVRCARQTNPQTETDEDIPEVETYSAFRFTGSVFTEEGLPVISGEMEELPAHYSYAYWVRGSPELGHEESRAEDAVTGRYWVVLPDRRVQEVRYTAGPGGFRPSVTYRGLQDLETVRSSGS